MQHGCELARVGHVFSARVVGHAAHPVQISASAKGGACASQHDAADVVARAEILKRLRQFKDDLVVEGVSDFGAVQGDGGDGASHSNNQVSHGVDGIFTGLSGGAGSAENFTQTTDPLTAYKVHGDLLVRLHTNRARWDGSEGRLSSFGFKPEDSA